MTDDAEPDWYLEHIAGFAPPQWRRPAPTSVSAGWQAWWRGQARVDPLVAVAARQGFVLASTQLPDLGVSRSTARTRVRRGVWSAPATGVVAPLDVDDPQRHVVRRRRHALLTSAAALRNPGLVAAARSSAVLHGLPTMTVPARAELLSATTGGPGAHGSNHRYRSALASDAVTTWFGVRQTDVARTVVDLARHGRRDGIMAADAALRENLTTQDALGAAVAAAAGWPGVVQAREVLVLADPRAESPLESVTRLTVLDAGFPAPELQYEIDGLWVDLCWPGRRLVLEADGLAKYSDDALHREKRRERRLRRHGFRVERVTWDDVVRHWPATQRWLAAALAA